jgi:hypothetical protein
MRHRCRWLVAQPVVLPISASNSAAFPTWSNRQLQAVGISRVISPGNGAMIRLETAYWPIYVRCPANVPRVAFVLEVELGSLPVQAEGAPAALAREAVRVTAANNRLQWLRANPWN